MSNSRYEAFFSYGMSQGRRHYQPGPQRQNPEAKPQKPEKLSVRLRRLFFRD